MKRLLVTHISRLYGYSPTPLRLLCGTQMAHVGELADAFVLVGGDGRFEAVGPMADLAGLDVADAEVVDAHGDSVLPSWCDPHTHLVYAGSREGEFVDKIRGLSYAEIAARGGGILNSADRLHAATDDELLAEAMVRVRELERKGTGAVEIKSGYGLNTADELKMLRVIRRIKNLTRMEVRSTFLGAHAVGREYVGRQQDYVDMLISEMLPAVVAEGLADYVDVFCDRGFFTPEQTAQILDAARRYGLRGKIHGQELADSGGVEVAVRNGAVSVDHLESATEADIALLRRAHGLDGTVSDGLAPTVPTALPGTSFFLNMPYAPARRMVNAGLPVAVASDYNPGSTPSGDMKFVMSLACIKLRLLPEEAFNAATVNAAAAMGLAGKMGTITPGLPANFYITVPLPNLAYMAYAYTTPLLLRAYLRGEPVE